MWTYLDLLNTYLLAWARAGVVPAPNAPAKETAKTESLEGVMVPFDVVMMFHDRASRKAKEMILNHSESEVLDWLVAHGGLVVPTDVLGVVRVDVMVANLDVTVANDDLMIATTELM